MKYPVTAILIGAGNRGTVYASYAKEYPEQLTVVAVADLKEFARNRIKEWFAISSDRCFSSWSEALGLGKVADCVIIATNDSNHKDPALAFARMGYHILLEKPMAVNKEDCVEMERVCREQGVMLAVCHVLRYLPPVLAIRQCIDDGVIGQVVNIEHRENVGDWHFAHSFVRGNWRNTALSSFSLLSKCCHDVDLIKFWKGDAKCALVSSFGSLFHFREGCKPAGAGERCLECDVEDLCAYSAKKIYLDTLVEGKESWPHTVVCDPGQKFKARLTAALREGPYGRCVYRCDNDVCDNQTVQFRFEDGSTATLTMVAFTEQLCVRETRIVGTKGELSWNGRTEGPVKRFDFLTRATTDVPLELSTAVAPGLAGHGGADFYLMKAFVDAVAAGPGARVQTDAADSLESHLMVFAAEDARLGSKVVDYQQYVAHAKSHSS